jgi:hypothetical protein|tara:strand:- start:16882 stop:17637 length:756 start_codon:yes stop_codon:yes gene_type:complete
MFDPKTIAGLKCYVYLLIDPVSKTPFYVGKGTGNRVFNHLQNAKDGKTGTEKSTEIQHILEQNLEVEHVIVRHGLNDKMAFNIEAALIDTFKYIPSFKTFVRGNIQGGTNSIEKGLMNAEEIARKYNAEPLDSITKECVIININSSYKRASGEDKIYQATKEIWKMKDPRRSALKYALSEYRGQIVEVFQIERWYSKQREYNPGTKKYGQTYQGYGFDGQVAPDNIRDKYINKSIAHKKKHGASNPITLNL